MKYFPFIYKNSGPGTLQAWIIIDYDQIILDTYNSIVQLVTLPRKTGDKVKVQSKLILKNHYKKITQQEKVAT